MPLFERTILLSNQTKKENEPEFEILWEILFFSYSLLLNFLIVKVWGHHQLSNFWLLHNYADEKDDEKLFRWLGTWDADDGGDINDFVSNIVFWKSW